MKVGDYLYYGFGTQSDHEAAAVEYRAAADANNAQAMFNLGIMHHMGDGLDHDIHLAKRFYDMALRTSAEAQMPASLALYWLYVSFFKESVAEWSFRIMPQLNAMVAKAVALDWNMDAALQACVGPRGDRQSLGESQSHGIPAFGWRSLCSCASYIFPWPYTLLKPRRAMKTAC